MKLPLGSCCRSALLMLTLVLLHPSSFQVFLIGLIGYKLVAGKDNRCSSTAEMQGPGCSQLHFGREVE